MNDEEVIMSNQDANTGGIRIEQPDGSQSAAYNPENPYERSTIHTDFDVHPIDHQIMGMQTDLTDAVRAAHLRQRQFGIKCLTILDIIMGFFGISPGVAIGYQIYYLITIMCSCAGYYGAKTYSRNYLAAYVCMLMANFVVEPVLSYIANGTDIIIVNILVLFIKVYIFRMVLQFYALLPYNMTNMNYIDKMVNLSCTQKFIGFIPSTRSDPNSGYILGSI